MLKDSLLKIREESLKKNLKKRRKFKKKIKKSMTVLSDKWITKAAQKGMIKPFVNKQVRKGKIFGLSSYGYDARVSNEFKIFTNVNSGIVDRSF